MRVKVADTLGVEARVDGRFFNPFRGSEAMTGLAFLLAH